MPGTTPPGGRPAKRPVRPVAPAPLPEGSKRQEKAGKLLMDAAQLARLRSSLRYAGLYVNSRHLEMLAPPAGATGLYQCEIERPVSGSIAGIACYRITKLMYNEDEDSFEKLSSMYSALNSFGAIVALIIKSNGIKNEFYLCTNTSGAGDVAGDLLEGNLRGQFPGCDIEKLDEREKPALLASFAAAGRGSKTIRSLSMIPSRREDERQQGREFSAQGFEKFIDAMSGRAYTLVIISQPVSPDAMDDCREGLEDLYTSLTPYAKEQVSYGESETDSVSYALSNSVNSSVSRSISKSFGSSHTKSISDGRSTNKGTGYEFFGIHFNNGSGTSTGRSSSDGTSTGTSTGNTDTSGSGQTDSETMGSTTGATRTLTLSRDNKAVGNLLMKIDEHIKRINLSQTFGMWNSACYCITDDVPTATIGASTLAALYAGDSPAAPRAYYNQWDSSCAAMRDGVMAYLQHLQHPEIRLTMLEEVTGPGGTKTTRPMSVQVVTPAVMISGKEIPTLMGFPRKSVPGIVADSMAEFGRNISDVWLKKVKRPVPFGTIYHMGQPEKTRTQTCLDLDAFASHLFICGASGSGKSNTTYNLLDELIRNRVPFLVIEPAKGEYKVEFAGLPGINIYTADATAYRQLQINPFEFAPGIHILEHLANLTQVVSACWPLYGAMPGILKQAFEQAYIDHGWDLAHSERLVNRGAKFPVFKDLLAALNKIIDNSPYSAQTKGDYRGALVNRVSSLCNGFEGQIFGSSSGIPDKSLFGSNTIIDLSSIGSDETRSLLMGVLIIKLREFRKASGGAPNSSLKHVTVLEEAHNILKRCSQETGVESGNVQGAAVGSLCRCIAELRSAGEGFMIIDQSPGAVDEAAIKNTAIKIVMRLPSRDDCEAMGTALSLNENQVKELSRLDIGVAAIYHVGWTDTVLARMGNIWTGKYRLSAAPTLSKAVLTKVQGAVVQLMYQNLKEETLSDVVTETEDLLEILCSSSLALTPALPPDKQKEILDRVKVFASDNDEEIREGKTKALRIAFSGFLTDFLNMESVLKIFPLKGVADEIISRPLNAKEIAAVTRWEKEVREAVLKFLYMPEQCDPVKAYRWPLKPYDAEYFWEIYPMILEGFARRYTADFRYDNALGYLNTSGYFARASRGR